MRRWLKRLAIGVAVLLVTAGVYVFLTIRSSYPQVNGELELDVLEAPVEVLRDEYGIPHIYADTSADLFRSQGFVEAQDRFFQMDFWRHIGSAELSSMFGASQLETDKFLRSLDFGGIARQELRTMSEASRQILEWYSEGVNAYLEDHEGAAASLEYAILPLQSPGYQPEPWTPVHTLTWAKVMSWDLSGNFRNELARIILDDHLGSSRVEQLFPGYPTENPIIIPGGPGQQARSEAETLPDGVLEVLDRSANAYRLLDELTGGGFEGIGSNNWVVDGTLTKSGAPLLANDPHLSIQMPSIWYEIGLHCRSTSESCPYRTVGFTFPGTPGIVVGHNENIAWGVTTQAADTQDLFIERLNPANSQQYEVDGEWVDMEVRTETIEVIGGEPHTYEVFSTRHGPVISGLFGGADNLEEVSSPDIPEEFAVSLAWQSLEPSTLVEAIIGINLASNWDEFRSAASLWDIAAQNLVYADIEGNIGYQSTGEIPIRPSSDGLRPVRGWDSSSDWDGIVPFEELPFLLNPDRGFIESANQIILPAGTPPFIGIDGAYGYRAARIEELLVENAPHTVESMQAIQMDERDGGAAFIVPALLDVTSANPAVTELQDLLTSWSTGLDPFQAGGTSAGAAAYEAIWRHLLLLTFHDDLPVDYWPDGGSRWFVVVRDLLASPDDAYWDDRDTDWVEDSDEIMERAMAIAHSELVERLGPDSEDWEWGDLHTAHFENQTLGQSGIGVVEWLFNRAAPSRVGGSASVVNAVGWHPPDGYRVDWVPSMRMVIDLDDFSRSTSVHTTGQSGHAFHANYADMIEMWTDGRQHPMLWTDSAVRESAADVMTLVPEIDG